MFWVALIFQIGLIALLAVAWRRGGVNEDK